MSHRPPFLHLTYVAVVFIKDLPRFLFILDGLIKFLSSALSPIPFSWGVGALEEKHVFSTALYD